MSQTRLELTEHFFCSLMSGIRPGCIYWHHEQSWVKMTDYLVRGCAGIRGDGLPGLWAVATVPVGGGGAHPCWGGAGEVGGGGGVRLGGAAHQVGVLGLVFRRLSTDNVLILFAIGGGYHHLCSLLIGCWWHFMFSAQGQKAHCHCLLFTVAHILISFETKTVGAVWWAGKMPSV